MYESYYTFISNALDSHPPQEREFDWGPALFDWRSYWLDVHMPGLRRWAFPLIEGKRPERYRAEHTVRLPERTSAPLHEDKHASEVLLAAQPTSQE
jgi:long-chain acyl-CoA synthetase